MLRTLTLVALACLLLTACAPSFRRCQSLYGHPATDTTHVTDTVTVRVPHDVISYHVLTDTTTVRDTLRQGRARLIYVRTPVLTTVQADCDTVTITRTVRLPCPPTVQQWGIAPWYRWAFYAALGAAVMGLLTTVLLVVLRR